MIPLIAQKGKVVSLQALVVVEVIQSAEDCWRKMKRGSLGRGQKLRCSSIPGRS